MNAPTFFGPCTRFRLVPVWHGGQTVAHDLFDAESRHGAQACIGRFEFATEAFADAALRVAPEDRERTAEGQCFIPN